MSRRLPADVYADLLAAGFSPSAAVTMTAIAGGESGYDTSGLGDTSIQTGQWGPSYGLYQIRTLRAETGKGTPRDIQWLAASPAHQAQAAYLISSGGSNFAPWTVYTTGRWQQFVAAAQDAARTVTTGSAGPWPTVGPDWAPWNWPSNAANAATSQALSGARNIALEGAVIVLGLALLGLGLARLVGPRAAAATVAAKAKIAGAVL